MAVTRRADEQTTPQEPHGGIQGERALTASKGEKTLSELASQFDVHANPSSGHADWVEADHAVEGLAAGERGGRLRGGQSGLSPGGGRREDATRQDRPVDAGE